jgi:hypothetical protein
MQGQNGHCGRVVQVALSCCGKLTLRQADPTTVSQSMGFFGQKGLDIHGSYNKTHHRLA